MNKEYGLLFIGVVSFVIMLPIVIIGIIYKVISTYFICGVELAEVVEDLIRDKLNIQEDIL